MATLTPFLWFDTNLKEITDFYKSVFPDATIESDGELSDTPSGNVEMATMTILGQKLSMMTAGPMFKFTEAISMMIVVDTQEELDYYWEKLTADGGTEGQCGWLKDKYGLSWQVVPRQMNQMLREGTPEQKGRVMQAFMQMKKFDIAALERAFAGE
jgi:predicted 3-demethylubiquinone-9 3-methyltransferase (glyoxalase superfamily)